MTSQEEYTCSEMTLVKVNLGKQITDQSCSRKGKEQLSYNLEESACSSSHQNAVPIDHGFGKHVQPLDVPQSVLSRHIATDAAVSSVRSGGAAAQALRALSDLIAFESFHFFC